MRDRIHDQTMQTTHRDDVWHKSFDQAGEEGLQYPVYEIRYRGCERILIYTLSRTVQGQST
jgi:hypothetical protein